MVLFPHDETGVTAARHLHQKYLLSQFVWWLWGTCWKGVFFFSENQLNVFYLLAPQFFSRSVAHVADVQQVREMNREGVDGAEL